MRYPRHGLSVAARAAFGGCGVLFLVGPAPMPAWAQGWRANPDGSGESGVRVVGPAMSRVGLMQYPQSLPLADKEVVLTFDDGPLPPSSNQILDILASQCVKVTYFLVAEIVR